MATTDFSELSVEETVRLNRGGVKILERAIPQLTSYFTDVLGMESGEDVVSLGIDGMLTSMRAIEIYGPEDPPPPVVVQVTTWYNSPVTAPKTFTTHAPKEGVVRKTSVPGLTAIDPGIKIVSTDKEKDMAAMELDEGAIKALALSIETGQGHTESEVLDMVYGTDPRLTDVARQRRKTGMDSLTKLIDAKDAKGIMVHFSSLIRDLNAEGKSQEVSIITGWLMEMQQTFSEDDGAMVNYVKEYVRRYRGRALPVKFDFSLFAKSIMAGKRGGGGMSEADKESLKAAKQAVGKVAELTSKLAGLKDTVETLKRDLRKCQDSSGDVKRGGDFTCDFCGMKGHVAKNCRQNPNSKNYDEKFADKIAAKKKEEEGSD